MHARMGVFEVRDVLWGWWRLAPRRGIMHVESHLLAWAQEVDLVEGPEPRPSMRLSSGTTGTSSRGRSDSGLHELVATCTKDESTTSYGSAGLKVSHESRRGGARFR